MSAAERKCLFYIKPKWPKTRDNVLGMSALVDTRDIVYYFPGCPVLRHRLFPRQLRLHVWHDQVRWPAGVCSTAKARRNPFYHNTGNYKRLWKKSAFWFCVYWLPILQHNYYNSARQITHITSKFYKTFLHTQMKTSTCDTCMYKMHKWD